MLVGIIYRKRHSLSPLLLENDSNLFFNALRRSCSRRLALRSRRFLDLRKARKDVTTRLDQSPRQITVPLSVHQSSSDSHRRSGCTQGTFQRSMGR